MLESDPQSLYRGRRRKADVNRGPHHRAQFRAAAVHLVGRQEVRFPPGKWVADDMLVVSGEGFRATWGVPFMLNLGLPFGKTAKGD